MVITLDKRKRPLGVCTEHRARTLMEKGRACVYRYYPFTIIIKDVDTRKIEPEGTFRVKIDPGAKHTGIAVVRNEDNAVVLFEQIEHRGEQIVSGLITRSVMRRNRRSRELRYRKPKWGNKQLAKGKKMQYNSPRPEGWLPPSERSIGDNVINHVNKLRRFLRITECSFEAVRFDTQIIDNPDISGTEYQQGTLAGYEIREYLLDKYGHTCQYCGGKSGDNVLEWEHIIPKSRGGSNSIKNATLACRMCNSDKDDMLLSEWIESINIKLKKNTLDKARIQGIQNVETGKISGKSNRYCAWTNVLRKYIEKRLFTIFDEVECASGGRTKYNRRMLNLPKVHHYDALCVGSVPEKGYKDLTCGYVLYVKAIGRGTRFRGKINKCGIITTKLDKRSKAVFGFMNGDIVLAEAPKGKYEGRYIGRVMTRASGSFDIRTIEGSLVTVNHKYCRLLQKNDGYRYRYAAAM